MNFTIPIVMSMLIGIQAAEDQVLPPVPDEVDMLPTVLFPMTPVVTPTIIPVVDPVPVPAPVPTPIAEVVSKLPYNAWYIIQTKDRMLVYASPNDLVMVTQYDLSATQQVFSGLFVNGNGEWDEEKTFPTEPSYKYAYRIKAVKSGTVELIFNYVGATEEATAIRQTLVVSGKGPNPPPIPDPDPTPNPDPTPDPSPTGIKVLLLYNENASRDQLNTVNSSKIVKWMNDNCSKTPAGTPIWRRWDKTSVTRTGVANETDTVQKLWAAVQPFIVQDNMVFVATDKKVHWHLMTTPENTLAFLQSVKDGK